MIEYTSNAKDGARWLGRAERQIPYATSLALNRTAAAIQKAITELMPQVFDRPTPYTLRGNVDVDIVVGPEGGRVQRIEAISADRNDGAMRDMM